MHYGTGIHLSFRWMLDSNAVIHGKHAGVRAQGIASPTHQMICGRPSDTGPTAFAGPSKPPANVTVLVLTCMSTNKGVITASMAAAVPNLMMHAPVPMAHRAFNTAYRPDSFCRQLVHNHMSLLLCAQV